MSISIMSAVFESEALGPTERLIMLALADHANDRGRCYPSIARLCKRTGLTSRTVQSNIRKLQETGYVSIQTGIGPGGVNVYFVTATPAGAAPPMRELHPTSGAPPCITFTPPLQETQLPPAVDAPKPSITIIEPSEGIRAKRAQPKQPRQRQLPTGWTPSPRNIADARSKHFTDEEIEDEANKFRDYHAARAAVYADWDARWRTWLGKARKFAPRGYMAGNSTPARHGQGSSIASVVARRRLAGEV